MRVFNLQSSRAAKVSAHPRARSEKNEMMALINSITDAVFRINQHGVVKTYNAAALNILDTNEDIRGRYISDLMNLETTAGKRIDIFKELSKNSTIRQRDDIIMRLPEDDHLKIEMTFAPVQSTSSATIPDSYVLIVKDITRMKSLEEERDEFISTVSHELRTPVTIVEGSLSNAKLLAERGLHDRVTASIDEAQKQISFLAKIVNDLSTLSRAERGITDKSELIDVRALGHQLHDEYNLQAHAKGLHLNLDIVGHPGTVHTSRLYLQELLQNFITNAIKYTPKGSVTLSIRQENEHIQFSVTDTGIGISKADRQKIFDRFYRAEDYRTRETNGTGLGLYVATKLAKKLGSTITVDSRLNHGSTFSITLPIHTSSK